MRTAKQLFLLGTLAALSAAAAAADTTAGAGQAVVDTSKWPCSLCKFEDGLSGTLEVGGGNVSDSSFKFGEYNGHQEKGGFAIGEAAVRYRGAGGTYANVAATNLGLDTRSVDAEGGQQGRYKLLLKYRQSPHFVSDSAQTPFVGSGGASLTLPAGFPAGATGLMPLAGTLRPVELETQRQDLAAGASWTPARAWAYGVNFRHLVREGTKGTAGTFFVNAAQLVAPVDYVTDEMDASASYTGARWQAKFAYYGSSFRDGNASLTWQNPFTPVFPGAVSGQLALPPDNQFHQISASLGYQLTHRTRATADIAVGRMAQDEAFLAPTLNATVAAPGLPRASLDGRVATLNASLKLNSVINDRLRLNAMYSHNDRDNRTPQAVYSWVTTDMFLAVPRTNLPYGFTQDKLALRADYRVAARFKASTGFDYDAHKRTFQEVGNTRENTLWHKMIFRPLDNVDTTLKLAHSDRRNSGYQGVAAITPPENPLLRKYNLANRKRDSTELRADIAATERISIGVQVDASEDDYSDSTIGLTSGRELNLSGDVSMMVSDETSLHFLANRQEIKSEQAGSQAFSTPDWRGKNKDTIDLFGIGVKHTVVKDKLDVGADYTLTRSKGAISVSGGAAGPAFPDLTTSRDSLKLHADYRIRSNLSLRAGYWYERYESENWMLSGVMPDTIPTVLTFGEQAPRYSVHVIAMSVRYKF
ncbi:MAG: MtrB/PioB family decaheme-associated outer membrane protein [Betaproteobacteria bacterium]|nr:MtrB/PioB family decaheme-associated outer membrane protein [Betaproteobacteria bacterium]